MSLELSEPFIFCISSTAPNCFYRLLNFIGNSITVFDQAAGLPVGVSGEARFPNAFSDFAFGKS